MCVFGNRVAWYPPPAPPPRPTSAGTTGAVRKAIKSESVRVSSSTTILKSSDHHSMAEQAGAVAQLRADVSRKLAELEGHIRKLESQVNKDRTCIKF